MGKTWDLTAAENMLLGMSVQKAIDLVTSNSDDALPAQ